MTTNFCEPFIAVAGLIGAGKTTFATELAKYLGLNAYYEPIADNELLSAFYNDMKKYSFALQVKLASIRFQQQQYILCGVTGGVSDRSIYEDQIFARMLTDMGFMTNIEFKTYLEMFNVLKNHMGRPDYIIYLDVDPTESFRRIGIRNREVERGKISLEYLQKLHSYYDEFMRDIAQYIPVIKIDWNKPLTDAEISEAVVVIADTIKKNHKKNKTCIV